MEELKKFTIEANSFLKKAKILCCYHRDYINYGAKGNPDFLVELKNGWLNKNDSVLNKAKDETKIYIRDILSRLNRKCVICVVPRSKANFNEKQLYFKKAVKEVVEELKYKDNLIIDGTDFIQRHTNVRTTHLGKHDNEGDRPYPGITLATCNIDNRVKACDIILIDDIYTKTINVIEDCIQALFDKGANSVWVYCVARTIDKSKNFQGE